MKNSHTIVMIVEDEIMLQEVYKLVLEIKGYTVITADNGRDALEKLRDNSPDFILLDMLMPIMDGIEFLKAADLTVQYPKVKTVIVSNLSEAMSELEYKKYGVVHSFLKANLTPTMLASVVKEFCS